MIIKTIGIAAVLNILCPSIVFPYNSFPLNIFIDDITDKSNTASVNASIIGKVIFVSVSIITAVFALAANNGKTINKKLNISFDLSYPNWYCTGI